MLRDPAGSERYYRDGAAGAVLSVSPAFGNRDREWDGTGPKRLYYREPFSIFSVLAERDWRFGVVQGDTPEGQ